MRLGQNGHLSDRNGNLQSELTKHYSCAFFGHRGSLETLLRLQLTTRSLSTLGISTGSEGSSGFGAKFSVRASANHQGVHEGALEHRNRKTGGVREFLEGNLSGGSRIVSLPSLIDFLRNIRLR